MLLATIDCGTTNSRVYIVNGEGKVQARASRKIGVRDTAISGSNQALKEGLREVFFEAVRKVGVKEPDIRCILSSGMITSELGLVEIPHLWAPCSVKTLSANLARVDDLKVFPDSIPLYFVPGIKNRYDPSSAGVSDVGTLDFMRGEEAQVAGLLATNSLTLPGTVVILSSHTKFIPVDQDGNIVGSVTTMSGQMYEAILKETFVGKSVRPEDSFDDSAYFNGKILDLAAASIENSGLLRGLMLPRFLDTLLHAPWYDRKLFTEGLLAAEDMRALDPARKMVKAAGNRYLLVGVERRCRIYKYLLEKTGARDISTMSKESEIDQLSIHGVISIARTAGVIE